MAASTQISLEEYLRASFEGMDQEYVDGEILERAVPTERHSRAQARLAAWLVRLEEKQAPLQWRPELRVRVGERRYRVVDIAVFSSPPVEEVPSSPPLIAIEILSPDDRFAEVVAKLEEYRAWGVAHVWLVDPMSRKIYVYSAGLSETDAFRLPEYGVDIPAAEIFR